MTRALLVLGAVLLLVCWFQARAVRQLKEALAAERTASSNRAFASQADELGRTLAWLDAQRRTYPASGEPRCEADSLLIENYLQHRARGASELEARAELLKTIQPK